MAERITLKCNPPKPARESTRMKRKKEDDDFIDISSRNALTFFSQPQAKKKVRILRDLMNQNYARQNGVSIHFYLEILDEKHFLV